MSNGEGGSPLVVFTVGSMAVLAIARSVAFHRLGWGELVPDTSLYVSGGHGLAWFYPSPIGRLLGLAGGSFFAYCAALSAGALVLASSLVAHVLSRSAALAALLLVANPISLWTAFEGVDALAVTLLLGAVLCVRHNRPMLGATIATGAVLTHLAVLPIVVAYVILARRSLPRLGLVAALAAVAVAVLAATPYGGVLGSLTMPLHAVSVVLVTMGVAVAPWALLGRRVLEVVPLELSAVTLGVATAIALQSADRATNFRYTLPVAVLFSIAAARKGVPWRTRTGTIATTTT